ncbi:hypothetical protein [Mumia zhuanghuii]|uniref:Uncharacterized protein n=1 Tax=Mumia zhuanghuii TaxID=2585211 RepID=A0A5C4MAC9_9ACTN|nr:hypothetical protein [Mumia zhuanghuii]TNC28440.1 hypothetical protein FHE65_34025 [Mumia zhuanghuii]
MGQLWRHRLVAPALEPQWHLLDVLWQPVAGAVAALLERLALAALSAAEVLVAQRAVVAPTVELVAVLLASQGASLPSLVRLARHRVLLGWNPQQLERQVLLEEPGQPVGRTPALPLRPEGSRQSVPERPERAVVEPLEQLAPEFLQLASRVAAARTWVAARSGPEDPERPCPLPCQLAPLQQHPLERLLERACPSQKRRTRPPALAVERSGRPSSPASLS